MSTRNKPYLRAVLGAVLAACATCGGAQVIELRGGSSSLYEATGGSITVHGASAELSLGTGMIAGKFVGGGMLEKRSGKELYRAGREIIPFDLPTDIFDDYHVVYAMGASIERNTPERELFAFGGATSNVYMSPFFEGMDAQSPVVIAKGAQMLSSHVRAELQAMVGQHATTIASLSFKPTKGLNLAASGGLGSGEPYGAASLDLHRANLDVKAAYILAGAGFRRLQDDSLQSPEPIGGNFQLAWRPWKSLTLSGGHQSYAMPLSCQTIDASGLTTATPCSTSSSNVDQAGFDLFVGGFGLSASAFRTNYNGLADDARIYSARRSWKRWVDWTSSYLDSRPQQANRFSSLVSNVSENFTPRFSLNETFNTSNSGQGSQKSFGFGGSWVSNAATFHADYETYYVASRPTNPFEQALIMDVQLNLNGGVGVHSETFVAPDGHLLYTADAREISVHGGTVSAKRTEMGPAELRGQVVDTKGQPVEGAALMINQMEVYTGSDGTFEVRERRQRSHPLIVLADQFLDGKSYRVVSAPPVIKSSTVEDNQGVTIVVAVEAGQ